MLKKKGAFLVHFYLFTLWFCPVILFEMADETSVNNTHA
jgi:hypothetical protein